MTPAHRRRRADAWTALTAAVAAAVCSAVAASGRIGAAEAAVFGWVNRWPEALGPALVAAQLTGVLGVPLLLAVPALALRRPRLALALVALVPLKLAAEHDLLKRLVERERPGSTIPGAVLRDVPSAGLAYPSGHAIVTAGVVVLLAPYVRRRWLVVLAALALLGAVARVHLGAHAPLDVLGGAATGVALGAVLNLLVGVPVERDPAPPATDRPPGRPVPAGHRRAGARSANRDLGRRRP